MAGAERARQRSVRAADAAVGSGIKAYYHQTLEDYLDAFQAGGLRLIKLADTAALAGSHKPGAYLPRGAVSRLCRTSRDGNAGRARLMAARSRPMTGFNTPPGIQPARIP